MICIDHVYNIMQVLLIYGSIYIYVQATYYIMIVDRSIVSIHLYDC